MPALFVMRGERVTGQVITASETLHMEGCRFMVLVGGPR